MEEFPVIVVLTKVPLPEIPPPAPPAELPEIVLLVAKNVPEATDIPPPLKVEVLFEMVLLKKTASGP